MTHALTPRQREIASLLAEGLSNEETAERLMLAKGTVANHVEHMLMKTGFRNRTQLAVWTALEQHGINTPFGPDAAPGG